MKGLIVFEGIWVYVFYINETALINDRILKLWPGLLQRAWIYLISEMCIYSFKIWVRKATKMNFTTSHVHSPFSRHCFNRYSFKIELDLISRNYANVIKFVYYIKIYIKVKIQKIHPVSTILKSNIKIVERGKIYTSSLFCIGTGTYIKVAGLC